MIFIHRAIITCYYKGIKASVALVWRVEGTVEQLFLHLRPYFFYINLLTLNQPANSSNISQASYIFIITRRKAEMRCDTTITKLIMRFRSDKHSPEKVWRVQLRHNLKKRHNDVTHRHKMSNLPPSLTHTHTHTHRERERDKDMI